MRWEGRRRSEHVEDRRGRAGPAGSGLPRLATKGGLGGIGVIALFVLVGWMLGISPVTMLRVMMDQGEIAPGSGAPTQGATDPAQDRLAEFSSVVLADTEVTWSELMRSDGGSYQEPTLVLFSNAVQSACGLAGAAVGPFYCPADGKLYLDLTFFEELRTKFQAPGDFAQAYVIAHEVGHHVQNLLGILGKVQAAKRSLSETEANALQVRVELQADCFAGVWAYHADRARRLLEAGDVAEGLRAAAAIGDDTLQKRTRGIVVPDSFTHGSSEQRVRWFRRGLDNGRIEACDTFSPSRL